ncbi:GNAT family N-acetyltransferase [Sporolactobacillus shoreicorticis]|uniref:GNAT family N-acetyltransferase n=1 Tax=Sporolactobacillus shoreicorticis TaxID=1923877 RepID=A0ABW5S1T9_9BACL|nr:GNAT family N-acetyltransferase [Sporolactobacillus shoreicorticis]MCO7125433.1 GNAT family N-acetyltransferase [Sporolactobacillus shoreicorticis]
MIRLAKSEDAGKLAKLCGQLGYEATEQEIGERLQHIMNDSDHAVFVYENSEKKLCGWVHIFGRYTLEGICAEIGGLVVDSQFRKQGIGRKLMEKCAQWAREHNYPRIRVRSGESRTGAHRFYNEIGYQTVKWQKIFDLPL